jgi:hypothetical protein
MVRPKGAVAQPPPLPKYAIADHADAITKADESTTHELAYEPVSVNQLVCQLVCGWL